MNRDILKIAAGQEIFNVEEIRDLLKRYINEDLKLLVASNPAKKGDKLPIKLKMRPVVIKREVRFQITKMIGAQEFHENLEAFDAAGSIMDSVENEPGFRQIEITSGEKQATVLISKKGHVTIKERKTGNAAGGDLSGGREAAPDKAPKGLVLSQDRLKNHIIPEKEPAAFLVELGVMNRDGYVVKSRYDKFRQINRYLEFVDDVAGQLPEKECLNIIDFGCGKSYLTFALYWYLHEKLGRRVNITGLDLKKEVIENCNSLAERLGYKGLRFLHGDIAEFETKDDVDMVVTLHACDTATDHALYNAVRWGAKVIMCVPCCQHELNKQIKSDLLKPVIRYGLIKERMSALITDALRADMLEEQGYKVQILEFIDMEHTPKNILIRAVKSYPKMQPGAGRSLSGQASGNRKASACGREKPAYAEFMDEIGADLTLYRLLNDRRRG